MPSLDILVPAFNAEHCLGRTLEAVFGQTVPAELELGVIVINNGSTDRTPELIDQWTDKGARRVDHDAGKGRAPTINAGAAASTADYLLILDADCRLHATSCFELLATEMAQKIGAGFGYVTGATDNFWGKYQRRLESDRIAAGWQGWTTPCCLIRRELFATVGGFPTDYEHYGFEDDDTNAQDVFEKMYESGRYSSGIFKRNHPDAYLATTYAAVDADTASTAMTMALYLLQPLRSILARATTWLTQRSSTPMFIGRPAVKLCSALSYFRGTVDRNRNQ